jgi:flagellar biogenesis protein FliO
MRTTLNIPDASLPPPSTFLARLIGVLHTVAARLKVHRSVHLLRVDETLPLGEHRSLLLVQCEHRRYLIGATPHTLTLLERLDPARTPSKEELCAVEDLLWKGLH